MAHYLQINGLDGPLLQQFGCDCGRCRAQDRQANTSASLIVTGDDGRTTDHILFDAGLGVVDSLLASPFLAGDQARLDAIVLTHWHPDHVAELNRLCVAHQNNARRRGLPWSRIPIHCRSGTAAWLHREQGHLMRTYLELHEIEGQQPPGTLLPPLPGMPPGVTVTPVAVSHYTADLRADDSGPFPACAGYVIETPERKVALLWDLDSENRWLAQPESEAEQATVARLTGADILAIDTCYWRRKAKRTTHPALDNVVEYVQTLQPGRTLLMHMSGHPDGRGNPGWGWTNAEWTAHTTERWAREGLPGEVMAPSTGQIFELG